VLGDLRILCWFVVVICLRAQQFLQQIFYMIVIKLTRCLQHRPYAVEKIQICSELFNKHMI